MTTFEEVVVFDQEVVISHQTQNRDFGVGQVTLLRMRTWAPTLDLEHIADLPWQKMEQEQGLGVVDVLFEFKVTKAADCCTKWRVWNYLRGTSFPRKGRFNRIITGTKQQVLPESPRLYFAAVVNKVSSVIVKFV